MSLLSAHTHPQEGYRSMPASPYLLDNARAMTTGCMDDTLQHVRMGLEGDYFAGTLHHAANNTPRYGGGSSSSSSSMMQRSRSPYGTNSGGGSSGSCYDQDFYGGGGLGLGLGPGGGGGGGGGGGAGMHEMGLLDLVRKTNLAVALVNGSVREKSQYSQIHPMMTRDGRFPEDFRCAKTVAAFKLLDSTQLDRILQAYHLPLDVRSIVFAGKLHGSLSLSSSSSSSSSSSRSISSSDVRNAKVHALYEFLGATRLVDYERLKRSFY
ncbi:MAG: hypothetical protein M1825_002246 [Sarcosagium campestre]|nr:MAG: hypothetical protein M1825_002246 [Sarcosagium campestre]